MKNLFTTLFVLGCMTAFAQKTIDGNWKGSVKHRMVHLNKLP